MAELTFKSAGVGTREIDLSGPTSVTPTGTPAGVIGTANRGPAFVPVTVANYQQFTSVFGETDGQFGPLAMYEWLRNANAGTYLRVLGVGDGKTRAISGINAGRVNNAGFVVGTQLVQDSGDLGANGYALGSYTGRTMFLGCFMSESNGSTLLTEAGIQKGNYAAPIIRGVLMTPSGVIATLSSSAGTGYTNLLPSTTAPTGLVGFFTGTMNLTSGKQEFVLFLSGHKSNDAFGNIITASFDPQSSNYFATLFNTDPLRIEEAGHYLHTAYDVYSQYAVPTGSNLASRGTYAVDSAIQDIAFILTSSLSRNSGSVIVPNYEGFEDRFQTAFSPGVVSQRFGDPVGVELFKVHSLDDGVYANTKVKVSIRNITPSKDPTSEYGTFDLFVRDFSDSDDNQIALESFVGLSMDPNNQRFVGKMIGDLHTYYDFDREQGSQKLVVEGSYPRVSNYIRVEIPESVIAQEVPASALPHGFKGLWHLVTSGSSFLAPVGQNANVIVGGRQPPVPMRKKIAVGTGNGTRVAGYLHWGTQFEANDSLTEPNKNQYFDNNIASHVKYFPKYHTDFANAWVGDNTGTPDANGTIYDADVFNKNAFTLENVQVITASSTGLPDSNLWTSASYVRDGSSVQTGYRFLKTTDLGDSTTRRFAKFTFPLQGGFDGVNVFDANKSKINDTAAVREMLFSTTQGGPNGPTVVSYRKALDILGEVADVDVQLLAIPGMREPGVTDYAIDTVENRFDALYVMDIQQLDVNGNVITGSTDIPSVTLTSNRFSNRVLDTSFGAAYYPDLVMADPGTGANLVVPPTVSVLGAFSLNDKVAYPWFAPAGFTRGALSDVIEAQVKLSRTNLDTLYSSNINPITTVPGSVSPVVYGQKTILARASALDRVNVRRLLIEIRRRVRAVANTILFEPNRTATLSRFSSLVDPILKQIQSQQGVDRYKVKIDTTTTTQADVENNTIRGKIFIQPTRSIEFVSLDFVVTNAGAQI
jgi:hypothetical protein